MTRAPSSRLSPEILVHAEQLRDHQSYVQSHLNGKLEDIPPLLPSFLPPASYWTSLEKDLFFHGLSIYSRLRPDLIAEHIKTKNTFDVCVYLDVLHNATLQEMSTREDNLRNNMKQAMEVSDDWVEREETRANLLTTLSSCDWSVDNAEEENTRAHAECICPYDQYHGADQDNQSDSREKEDEYLNHLDSTSLMVLESIIREASSKNDDPDGDFMLPQEQDLEEQSMIQTLIGSEYSGTSTNMESTNTSNKVRSGEVTESVDPLTIDNAKMRRRVKNRIYMRRKRATKMGQIILPGIVKLRPGRKVNDRKPSKSRPKTYNTKLKRMDVTKDADSVDLDTAHKLHAVEPDNSPSLLMSMTEDEVENGVEYTPKKGGVTRPYRIKKLFQDNGLDAQKLADMNLDFFNLSTMRRLLRLLNILDKHSGDSGSFSISANAIMLLSNLVQEFIAEVVRHAIITKEQETRQKQSLKVWKYERYEISGENMNECLHSMGLGFLKKERILQHMTGERFDEDASHVGHSKERQQEDKKAQRSRSHHQFTLPGSLFWTVLPHYRSQFCNEDLLPESIDEAVLQQELDEEEKLDAEDKEQCKEFLDSLWNMK